MVLKGSDTPNFAYFIKFIKTLSKNMYVKSLIAELIKNIKIINFSVSKVINDVKESEDEEMFVIPKDTFMTFMNHFLTSYNL